MARASYPLFLLMTLVVSLASGSVAAGVAQDSSTPTIVDQPINILLLGSDARPGEAIDGVRSDIITVLNLDPTVGSCRLLSIPRDTRVDIPGIGSTKINHALMEGGVPLTQQTVLSYLGVEIDYYALIDFVGAEQVIDAIGGVTIMNDTAFELSGYSFPAGEQRLTGPQAVAFARYRGGPDGDFGRMRRQQIVLEALIEQVSNASIPEVVRATLTGLDGHFMTDLVPFEVLALASTYMRTCTPETIAVDTLAASTQGMYRDDLLQQDLWFVIVDPAEVQQKVQWLLTGE